MQSICPIRFAVGANPEGLDDAVALKGETPSSFRRAKMFEKVL